MIYVEHRILHFQKGPCRSRSTLVRPAKRASLRRDRTSRWSGFPTCSWNVCARARYLGMTSAFKREVIDPIWLSPLDIDTIVESVRKTGRLCVVDNGWTTCGAGAEIVACGRRTRARMQPIQVQRLGFAPVTCPPTPTLEDLYYPNGRTIAAAVYDLVTGDKNNWLPEERAELQRESNLKVRFRIL